MRSLAALVLLCLGPLWAERHIVIDKGDERLLIKDGDRVLAEYPCSLGKGGSGAKRQKGDNLTPEGEYRIARINRQSGFHIFLHLSYPNSDDIEKAKAENLIGDSLYQSLKASIGKGVLPPQNTILGGDVGIHGLRNGFGWVGRIHRAWNWTQGCIAVTNPEIEEIAARIEVGTRVIIQK